MLSRLSVLSGEATQCNDAILNIANIVLIILPVLYVLVCSFNYYKYWYNAEKLRREQAIKSGLASGNPDLDNYYSNGLDSSAARYGLCTYESLFYSERTASGMASRKILKLIAVAAVSFLAIATLGTTDASVLIMQTFFFGYVVFELVNFFFLHIKLKNLLESFGRDFEQEGPFTKNQICDLIVDCEEYECLKAFSKVPLSPRIFDQHKEGTKKDWLSIESRILARLDCDRD